MVYFFFHGISLDKRMKLVFFDDGAFIIFFFPILRVVFLSPSIKINRAKQIKRN